MHPDTCTDAAIIATLTVVTIALTALFFVMSAIFLSSLLFATPAGFLAGPACFAIGFALGYRHAHRTGR